MINLNISQFTKSYCLMLIVMSIVVGMFFSCSRKNKVGSSQTTTTLTLKVQKKGTGSITASWNGGSATETQLTNGVKIPQGTKVTLTATPSSDNAYVLWNNTTKSKTYQMTMDKDNSVTVSIVYQYLLTVSKTGKGIVTASWTNGSATDAQLSAGALVDENTAITLTATPDASMPNVVWNGNITGNTLPLTITANQQVSVAFSATPPTLYALNITQPLITEGIITAYSDATFTIPITDLTKIVKDAKVYIKVVPATGKKVTQLIGIDAGSTNSDNTEAVVTMTANKTISASFETITYQLTLNTATNGTIQAYTDNARTIPVADLSKIPYNTPIYIKATPANDYIVYALSGIDAGSVNSDNTQAVVTITSNKSITATFEGDPTKFIFTETATEATLKQYTGTLTSVTIPSTYHGKPVTVIGSGSNPVFSSSVTEVIIPNSVTSIGNDAFRNCGLTGTLTIPNSVKSIGQSAFLGCIGLTSIAIPNNVKSIGQSAFLGCTGLTNVTISSSVTTIGNGVFYDCSKLTSITVDIANPNYSSMNGVLFDKPQNTIIAFPAGKAGAYTIPSSVTNIENNVFVNCIGLTSVTIPSDVTSIGVNNFSNCSVLTDINVDNTNANYSSINGVLFNKAQTTIIKFPTGKTGTYTIPSSVMSIGNNAFRDCIGLTSVAIPNNVTSIGGMAFAGCRGLTDVIIQATTPPTMAQVYNMFDNTPTTFKIHVPSGYATIYQGATGWSYYSSKIIDY